MKRRPGFPWRFTLACIAVILAIFLHAKNVSAQETPRYEQVSRGPRASYHTEQVQQWREAASAFDWDVDQALMVIACESTGDPEARNPSSGATGLLQVMPSWRYLARILTDSTDLTDVWVNLTTSYYLWRDSGGTFRWHWAASIRCWGW